MRTDAKIGFAIVGVLVAVLAVYAVVIPRHNKQTKVTTSASTPSDGTVRITPSPSDNVVIPPPGSDSAPPSVAPTPATNGKPGTDNPSAVANGQTPSASTDAPPVANATNGGTGPKLNLPLTPDEPLNPAISGTATPDHKSATTGDHGTASSKKNPARSSARRSHKPSADEDGSGPAVTTVADRTYTVRAGQTLTSIASDLYGDPHAWVQIQKANPKLNPNRLRVGTKILIPDPTAVRPHPSVVVPAAEVIVPDEYAVSLQAGQTYRVRNGDTLYAIARRFLGTGSKADAVYELNRDVIGPKMRLKPGTVLRLPTSSAGVLSDASR